MPVQEALRMREGAEVTEVEPRERETSDTGSCKLAIPRTAVFIDGGFITSISERVLGRGVKVRFAALAKGLGAIVGDDVFRVSFYDCPPAQRPEEGLSEEQKLEQREKQRKKDRFLRALAAAGIHVRYGVLVPAVHAHYTLDMLLEDLKVVLQQADISDESAEEICAEVRREVADKMDFVQKGVDSALITDLVSLAALEKITTAIVVSNDADFAPALKFAMATGVRTVVVGPPDGGNHYLVKYADMYIPLTKDFLQRFAIL